MANPNAVAPRGGARLGAGRKPKHIEAQWQTLAQRVLLKAQPESRLLEALQAKDHKLNFEIIRYLMDRILGKPAQMIIGDPNRPVAVQISWSAGAPDWIDVTPEPEKLEP